MVFHGFSWFQVGFSCFFMVFHGSRCEARHETYRTPKLVTTRRSILGPPAEGRPGPSDDNDDCGTQVEVQPNEEMWFLMIVVQSASNLWEEQRAWLLGLDTQLVKYIMMLVILKMSEFDNSILR